MNNIPATLVYGKRTIRLVVMNGIPKFSATDICNILGYVNPNKTLGRFCESSPEYVRLQTSGGPQNVRIISPNDVRDIMKHTRRRNAAALNDWFENTVFPMFQPATNISTMTGYSAQ